MKKYVIYEVVGVKIGATTRWPGRVTEQGYGEEDCKVLFETDVLMLADSMERVLQKKYGYCVDSPSQSFSRVLKLRETNLGSKASFTTRKKMSETRRGSNNGFYGKKHKDSTRKKMSDNHYDCSGGKNPAAKPIRIFGILYETIRSASLSDNVKFKGTPAIKSRLDDPENTNYVYEEQALFNLC